MDCTTGERGYRAQNGCVEIPVKCIQNPHIQVGLIRIDIGRLSGGSVPVRVAIAVVRAVVFKCTIYCHV